MTRVRLGERIAIEPAMACGTCDQCLAGRSNTCRHMRFPFAETKSAFDLVASYGDGVMKAVIEFP